MRLNQEREIAETPKRFEYAITELKKLGFEIIRQDKITVCFIFKEAVVTLYPYSGWHTGKTVVDGRGIENLLKQLKA